MNPRIVPRIHRSELIEVEFFAIMANSPLAEQYRPAGRQLHQDGDQHKNQWHKQGERKETARDIKTSFENVTGRMFRSVQA